MSTVSRVCVVGCAGAGKSHLADRLGTLLDLPVTHLDALYWRPGWVEPPQEDWRAIQRDLVRAPRWILDGNYGATQNERFPHADLVVFLDYSTIRCLTGVLARYLREPGQRIASGCPRRLSWDFIRYILSTRPGTALWPTWPSTPNRPGSSGRGIGTRRSGG